VAKLSKLDIVYTTELGQRIMLTAEEGRELYEMLKAVYEDPKEIYYSPHGYEIVVK
jgi:hypothetical protein